MNIKKHIKAGRYPKDDQGRALVPMSNGDTFVVCATDKPRIGDRHYCIIGWAGNGVLNCFDADGWNESDGRALLPPQPRKVKETRWAVYSHAGTFVQSYETEREARVACNSGVPAYQIVELTGEREEPWS